MSRLTHTLPLAPRPQTWSTPSYPPSSETQAHLIPDQVPHPLPPSTNYNHPSQTRHGLRSRYTPSPITNPRPNNPIPLLNHPDCPSPNRPLLPPPIHPPPPLLSPTLPRSFRALLRTLPPISLTLPLTIRALHRPYHPVIPATPPPQRLWATFVYTRMRLVLIPSTLPHTLPPHPRARPTRAVWTTFPFVFLFWSLIASAEHDSRRSASQLHTTILRAIIFS